MPNTQFHIGQVVEHKRFEYRAVVYAVDSVFSLSDKWYDEKARSRPPKDMPWYHLMVDNSGNTTYVAERHLIKSLKHDQINHPLLGQYFNQFSYGEYQKH